MKTPIRIVGGGITGLTLALRLVNKGVPVIVHEGDPFLGGLTGETTVAGIPVERFYHCISPTDLDLLELLRELGLESMVRWRETRAGFFTGSTLLDLTTMRDFLAFPVLNFVGRLRLGWTIAYCALNRTWTRLDKEPISAFLKRHSGDRVFRLIWEPLLLAKLGTNYDRFAASFIWATVYRMLSARKAKGRSEKLGYIMGGYGRVFAALRCAIEKKGGAIMIGEPVEGINRLPDGTWNLRFETKEEQAAGVVLCIPSPVAVTLLDAANSRTAGKLRNVEYLGVVCEVIVTKRSLTPYYVLNLTDRGFPFTGVIEMSNLTGIEESGGLSVVYLPRYCSQQSELWKVSDNQIHTENMSSLRIIDNDFGENMVVDWKIVRARYVQPIHPVGWGDCVPPVELERGLAYVSTAQIHPWPVFNNEAVHNVDGRLEEIIQVLGLKR